MKNCLETKLSEPSGESLTQRSDTLRAPLFQSLCPLTENVPNIFYTYIKKKKKKSVHKICIKRPKKF